MIIQYDTRPDATIDEKLRSLIDSLMLAFGEIGIREDNTMTSQNVDMYTMGAQIRRLSALIDSVSESLSDINEKLSNLEAPTEDGTYILKATVTDGIPEYTWESE